MRAKAQDRETPAARRPPWLVALRPWIPIVFACALLSAYSARSGNPAPVLELSWRDKLDHFSVYALLGLLVVQALPLRLQGTSRWLCAFLLVSSFGLCDELIQHFNPARTGDPLDWLADSLGSLLAIVFYTAFAWPRAIAQWRPFKSLRAQLARPWQLRLHSRKRTAPSP